MAKPKADKTPIQKTADAARAAWQKAKEADEKNSTAATKKALEDATAARNTAVTAESRERFLRVGSSRVQKAITALGNIGKLAAPRSYEYGDDDVSKLETAVTTAAKNAIGALRAAKQKGGGKTAAAGFSFE